MTSYMVKLEQLMYICAQSATDSAAGHYFFDFNFLQRVMGPQSEGLHHLKLLYHCSTAQDHFPGKAGRPRCRSSHQVLDKHRGSP
ncbi:hypothetical protein GDO81_027018 [Engystomops pustulosus]|uniref:Uncharacterized protein n=1 Tax=Engystomops pustulosus TaxID=76066 RepID=A0AAV6YJ56_ENGPU|nr:hypothetical protein GDO81_027018 [Engystomops pustulosus]